MSHPVLENLRSDDFVLKFACISNARAVHWALERCEEVEELKLAMRREQITEDSLRRFVSELLETMKTGELFPYDLALAAIAVALETWASPFAEEYILDLARIRIAEIPIATRVARECTRKQLELAGNKSTSVSMDAHTSPPSDWQRAMEPHEVMVSESDRTVEFEAA